MFVYVCGGNWTLAWLVNASLNVTSLFVTNYCMYTKHTVVLQVQARQT